MKILSMESFYRPAFDEKATIEDGLFINPLTNTFGVADGDSAAYSPKNPPLLYWGNLTGGQMVIRELSLAVYYDDRQRSLQSLLLLANVQVLSMHQQHKKDPTKDDDDVGGASFAFCQPREDGLHFLLGGDCFALVDTDAGPLFLTAFDKAAFKIEKNSQDHYTECLKKANGNKGDAWDLYWLTYKAKRIFCANKNIGLGGYATLNGDPALEKCWKEVIISWDDYPKSVLLGTDGLLPPSEVNPEKLQLLAETLYQLHLKIGIPSILAWRDEVEKEKACLTHIEGWPEATAFKLQI